MNPHRDPFRARFLLVGLISCLIGLASIGCGGPSPPPERTDELEEQIKQEDTEVADGETEL